MLRPSLAGCIAIVMVMMGFMVGMHFFTTLSSQMEGNYNKLDGQVKGLMEVVKRNGGTVPVVNDKDDYITSLVETTKSMQDDIIKLQTQVEELSKDLKATNEQLKNTNTKLQETNTQLKDNNDKLKDNNDKLKDNNDKLKDNNDKLTETNNKLKDINNNKDTHENSNTNNKDNNNNQVNNNKAEKDKEEVNPKDEENNKKDKPYFNYHTGRHLPLLPSGSADSPATFDGHEQMFEKPGTCDKNTSQKYVKVGCAKGGGINDCRMVTIEAMYWAHLTNRTLILPPLRPDVYSDPSLPYSSVFDVEYMNYKLCGFAKVLEKAPKGIDIDGDLLKIPFQVRRPLSSTLAMIKRDQSRYDTADVLDFGQYHSSIGFENPEQVAKYHRILHAFRGSQEITDIVKDMEHTMREVGNGKFGCLHLRLEKDWKAFYTKYQFNMDYATPDHILRLIEESKVPTQVDALYVAGGDTSEELLAPFRKLFKKVYTKSDFSDFPLIKMETNEVNSQKGILDFEMCRLADVFIGNQDSLWTKNVALYMNYENKPVYRYNVPTLVPYCDIEFQKQKCEEIREKWNKL